MADPAAPPTVSSTTNTTAAATAAAAAAQNGGMDVEPALVAAPVPEDELDDEDNDDGDSAIGSDVASSTNSISASILEYRTIQGRTYHSERHNSSYFTPNDDQQLQSQDLTHHYLMVLLDNKLYLPPIRGEDLHVSRHGQKTLAAGPWKVLDVGTGSGIWAIDLADQFPHTEIIGTDLSPTMPLWVPPNVKFEIDDLTQPWTWAPNQFDLVHARYLFGAVADWGELFRQAWRVCRPGGWCQSGEADVEILSDDGTVLPNSAMNTFWNMLYREAGRKLGVSFQVVKEGLQRRGMEEAGFVDIQEISHKIPCGSWPQDPKLAEVGTYLQATMLNDVEGYTLFLWNTVMGENAQGYQESLAFMRRELKSRRIHGYMKVRYVWGRKPE
ncbi:S-adenosyl-L-methionine-dependent methyltransferase [Biscogniauxia sp. FL1348]|nr:S-adenosyl-L-methionine-dependent methyltransferase [Biscogniauxia sp. FL1348]